uniref:Hypothetical chloroplast RF1 n=1 Tax=Treubaria triappendiculata TaxID=1755147 RepID=A0A0S2LN79_TRETR|nr:hypothetical chloroplast RF1 [Treubaria triappendiculata]ALO62678.1 hypothetical chloroplast RF1 [Treubaria triappendiculata]
MNIFLISLVTTTKDYIEIINKLIELDTTFDIKNYLDFGAIITFFILTLKENFFSINWNISNWSIPIFVPEIASSMISEISVLNGYFHNMFNFLENPLSYGNQNLGVYCLEKFTIGFINSGFLWIPTSVAHVITIRRFVMQGLEAGYFSGLGSIAGNVLWLASIIFGWRFLIFPWISIDILRYLIGFLLLLKYMWESYSERRTFLEDVSKKKIFLLNFVLAFTEQATLFPFLGNISIGSDSSFLEIFPIENSFSFFSVHIFYLLGIILGSLSFLYFNCWFWENPAFRIYTWMISSLKVTSTFYYKFLNFFFLYVTMIFAICNFSYFSLDYTLTNPLGFVHEDKIIEQKKIFETSFLYTKGSDRNTRRNLGRHCRPETWEKTLKKYRTFDASLYDQGIYDLFTLEDLNFGFDRFWLRRKTRNNPLEFQFFPGPWARSFKKQVSGSRLESFLGPRIEFFRILFEQAYHPVFHDYRKLDKNTKFNTFLSFDKEKLYYKLKEPKKLFDNSIKEGNSQFQVFLNKENKKYNSSFSQDPKFLNTDNSSLVFNNVIKSKNHLFSLYLDNTKKNKIKKLHHETSALRKFARKFQTRITTAKMNSNYIRTDFYDILKKEQNNSIISKKWKNIFSKIYNLPNPSLKNTKKNLLRLFYKETQLNNMLNIKTITNTELSKKDVFNNLQKIKTLKLYPNEFFTNSKVLNMRKNIKRENKQILQYKTFLMNEYQVSNKLDTISNNINQSINKPITLLHPLKFYLHNQKSFEKKLKFYGIQNFREIAPTNNGSYFRVMLRRFFYYYKPTLRWKKTLRLASMRKYRRKGIRIPRKLKKSTDDLFLRSLKLNFEKNPNFSEKIIKQYSETNKINENNFTDNLNDTLSSRNIQKPTHFYSLIDKRTARYRSQIYKDVFQHWYYTPFNRLFLKLDIDSFIRRQPSSQFLTKKEENLLHLKRFLLFEHYETLRWYNMMEQYPSMKIKLGGTKSFASKIYNQQFQGTFKKIRHLFSITPSFGNNLVLKFDQPMYNEFVNKKEKSIAETSFIHEELLSKQILNKNISNSLDEKSNFVKNDLFDDSVKILKNYFIFSKSIHENSIEKLFSEKTNWELTPYLLNDNKKILDFDGPSKKPSLFRTNKKELTTIKKDLWFSLTKKYNEQVYGQKFLKNNLKTIIKKQKQKKQLQIHIKKRMKRIKNWFLNEKFSNVSLGSEKLLNNTFISPNMIPSVGIQKAIKDAIKVKMNDKNYSIKKWKFSSTQLKKQTINQIKENLKIQKQLLKYVKNIRNNLKNIPNNSEKLSNFQIFKSTLQKNIKTLKNTTRLFSWPIQKSLQIIAHKANNILIFFENPLEKGMEKNINFWRKNERVMSKRKRLRKRLRRLRKRQSRNDQNIISETKPSKILKLFPLNNEILKKKQDYIDLTTIKESQNLDYLRYNKDNSTSITYEKNSSKNSWKSWLTTIKNKWKIDNEQFSTEHKYFNINNIVSKFFKRKKSRRKKYARNRRTAIRKQTLDNTLRRQYQFIKLYSKYNQKEEKTDQLLNTLKKSSYVPNNLFDIQIPKYRKTKLRKNRFWRKYKRRKYSQKKRNLKKRRRYAQGKIKVLAQQLTNIKTNLHLKKWWWENYLPNYKANKQLSDSIFSLNEEKILQTENKIYKPLSIFNISSLRAEFAKKEKVDLEYLKEIEHKKQSNILKSSAFLMTGLLEKNKNEQVLNKQSFDLDLGSPNEQNKIFNSTKFLINSQSTPFYTGWDENSRKFILTNRLLSRKDANYITNLSNIQNEQPNKTKMNIQNFQFSSFPFQGMNAATTLYWKAPFTTYDPDQLFALGMDGFSPIGWRRFQFRHIKQTTKPIIVKTNILASTFDKNFLTNYKIKNNIISNLIDQKNKQETLKLMKIKDLKESKSRNIVYRRTQKRYKRVKKYPRSPIWFPSGSLNKEVLPVHYIYVFYKRYRLPRNRYIRRRVRRNKDGVPFSIKTISTFITDFTLRKRIKSRRKYHRRQQTIQQDKLTPLRRKFTIPFLLQFKNKNLLEKLLRSRPTSKSLENIKFQKREKHFLEKQQSQSLRIRQLRRRIQRQVFAPVARYKPKAGGFIWPGDYLRLELMRGPKLKTTKIKALESNKNNNVDYVTDKRLQGKQRRRKKRKKRKLEEWIIQPKKHLYQKHNIQVLKNRLEKSQQHSQLPYKIKEFMYLSNKK